MNDTSPAPRSRLVTILAWCFIAYSSFGLIVAAVQFVLVSTVLTSEQLTELTKAGYFPKDLPAYVMALFQHAQAISAAILIMQAITLTGAIALLKRRHWARLFFIVMLALGVVWNIAGIFIQRFAMAALVRLPADVPLEFRSGFEAVTVAMQMISGVMAIALSVLFAWLIKKLLSEPIRREFA